MAGSLPFRVACLAVPRFVVASLHRAEPELRGCPLIVAADPRPRALVLDVSAEAARRGVRAGSTVAQALAVHADLVVRPLDLEALAAGAAALADVAGSVSPLVELAGLAGQGNIGTSGPALEAMVQAGFPLEGIAFLDVTGCERAFGSFAGLAAALTTRAGRLGFTAGVGIADVKPTAHLAGVAAAVRSQAIVVPPGGDAAWLAPLPIDRLARLHRPASKRAAARFPVLAGTLRSLGISRVGELAAWPLAEVASRLGPEAGHLRRIADGSLQEPLTPRHAPLEVTEGAALEWGVSSLEALLFVVRGLIDRATARLRLHALSCAVMNLELRLEDGGAWSRRVELTAPTLDTRSLLTLLRQPVEAAPPQAAIASVRLTMVPDRPRPDQLELFRPAGPSPTELATTLARLAALCGRDRVGRAIAPRGYRREDFRLAPFVTGAAAGAAALAESPPERNAFSGPALVLRAFRPPRRAEVHRERGVITVLRADGLGGRVVGAAGPWRIEAEWWSEAACCRDYFDVQLSDGGVYRIFRDRGPQAAGTETWYVEGCYD